MRTTLSFLKHHLINNSDFDWHIVLYFVAKNGEILTSDRFDGQHWIMCIVSCKIIPHGMHTFNECMPIFSCSMIASIKRMLSIEYASVCVKRNELYVKEMRHALCTYYFAYNQVQCIDSNAKKPIKMLMISLQNIPGCCRLKSSMHAICGNCFHSVW